MKSNTAKVLACGLLTATSAGVEAASEYYLKIGDIKGEATDKLHKDYIDILTFSWGASSGPGGATPQDFSWVQALDTTTPALSTATLTGEVYKTAQLAVSTSADGKAGTTFDFFTMDFTDVTMTNINISGAAPEKPVVNGSFEFRGLTLTVTPMTIEGKEGTPVSAEWDVAKGFTGDTFIVFSQLANLDAPLLEEATVVPLPASLPFLLGGVSALLFGARRNRKT